MVNTRDNGDSIGTLLQGGSLSCTSNQTLWKEAHVFTKRIFGDWSGAFDPRLSWLCVFQLSRSFQSHGGHLISLGSKGVLPQGFQLRVPGSVAFVVAVWNYFSL